MENPVLFKRKEFNFLWTSKARFKAVVAARGAGKTVAVIQYAVESLLKAGANDSAAFFSGTLAQAKATVEPVMRQIACNMPKGFMNYNKSEHKYEFIFSNFDVRTLTLLSYENQESKRGYHPRLIIIDECSSMPASMFGNVIMPMLKDESGELIAIGTPAGHNKFYDLFEQGLDEDNPDWESYAIRASENTHLFPAGFLRSAQQNLSLAEYQQEYECDFNANVLVGSVYGEFMRDYTDNNVKDTYSWKSDKPVHTAWDLGFTDYTAIWFFQVENDVVTFIDYMEESGRETEFYARELLKKPYVYGKCMLPHDGTRNDMRGRIDEQLRNFGFRIGEVPKTSIQAGISKARTLLKTARFSPACITGLNRLRQYKYKLDKKTGLKLSDVEHDENSHGADAFRYAALSIDQCKPKNNGMIYSPRVDYNVFDY